MEKNNINNKENMKLEKVDRGIDAFVLSIIACLTIGFWYISIPASIYGLVRGIIAIKRLGKKLAKAGFIISLISITLCVTIYTQLFVIIFEFF